MVKGKDTLMRKVLLKRAAVPKGEDMVTKLLEAPGITSGYFYQLDPSVAVMGLMATLEQMELQTFSANTEAKIKEPLENFYRFFNQGLGQLMTVNIDESVKLYPELTKSTSVLLTDLRKQVEERNKLFQTIQGNEDGVNRSLIKLTRKDFEATLRLSTAIVRDYFTNRVFSKMSEQEKAAFWRSQKLPADQWLPLTRNMLAQTFSPEFLSPLEDSDARFRFVVKHEGLERDLDRLVRGLPIDDGAVIPIIEPTEPTRSTPRKVSVRASDVIPGVLIKNACQIALDKN